MKVLYDITVLGQGYTHPRYRTGIYRVIEELANRLATMPECDLEFCAIQYLYPSIEYLRQSSTLQHIPLRSAGNRIGAELFRLDEAIGQEQTLKNLPSRLERKVLALIKQKLTTPLPLISRESLESADVLHSLFYPLPEETRGVGKLKRFLTIYDLIPLLHPQFCTNDTTDLIHNVVESIAPEDRVLAISEATKQDLCAYKGIDPSRVFVTPLAADTTRFYPLEDAASRKEVQSKYGIPDAPYVLAVGTLEPRKNLNTVIESFAQLAQQEKGNDLHLVITGNLGWDYDGIFKAIEKLPALEKRIHITGYVEDGDLAALYSGAMTFVYMSFYEGFGLPPLEAMQCGVPVVTSNTSSLPEVVGDAGVMLSPTDRDALSQTLLRLYHDSQLREEMRLKALHQSTKFSWEQCAQQTFQAYAAAL